MMPRGSDASPDDWAGTLAAARAGDERAWSLLYRAFKPLILKTARRWGFDQDVAEELVNDCFTRLAGRIGEIRDARAIAGYLKTTANRLLVDLLRHTHAEKRGAGERPLSLEVLHETGHDPVPDGADAATARIEEEERLRIVGECLAEMEPPKRALLLMREVDGLDYAEISRRTGVKKGALAVRVHRYKEELRLIVLRRCRERV